MVTRCRVKTNIIQQNYPLLHFFKYEFNDISPMKNFLVFSYSLLFLIFLNTVKGQEKLLDTLAYYIEDFQLDTHVENKKLWGVSFDLPLLIKTKDFVVCSEYVEGFTKYKNIYFGTPEDYTQGGNSCVYWRDKSWATFKYDPARFNDRKSRMNLFYHETFHCNQYILDLTGKWTLCKHLNEFDARCLMQLEYYALSKALKADKIDTVSIISALSFRAYRYALYPNAYREEGAIEMLEGIANYTGLKLSGKTYNEILSDIKSNLSNVNPQLFAYWTGASYCFILDKIDSTWRKQIHKNDNFLYFTQAMINIQLPASLKEYYTQNRELYNWDEIKSKEKKIMQETKQKDEHYTQQFFKNPAVHISLSTCQGITFNSTIIFPLNNGKVYNGVSTS